MNWKDVIRKTSPTEEEAEKLTSPTEIPVKFGKNATLLVF